MATASICIVRLWVGRERVEDRLAVLGMDED